ncbi:hypothetical protein CI109_103075 [Kwoniella shandongensis]|uniref:Uncharacterized protein n=1 Tax=Kwoniella shandongensis TaxID=1734106 RepID=A0A5M6CDA3_9TREE|nr:uncharacterized protein CI109_000266 [Kwoniella shandongensis]KAA5531425.1 hypothetical protein CI109_000266 [Kwoniella shandongensis]
MGDLQQFDSLLETTIKAPRLSGTKVSQLTELSQKLIQEDHHLITTFFKLNASLPSCSQARISSLYIFDSIARACRNAVIKGKGREVRNERGKGTQAGMLLKLEGVVDSWVDGMMDDGKGGVWTEGKEKTRKIVDIWSKHGTFPQPCLDRLSSKVTNAGPQAGPSMKPLQRTDSSSQGQGSTTPPLPPPASDSPHPGGLPPEIAKLLGIAASAPTQGGASPSLSNNTSVGATSGAAASLDIAAILASVTKTIPQPQSAQAQVQSPHVQGIRAGPSQHGISPTSHPTANLPNFDLANLANLTNLIKSPLAQSPSQNGNASFPPAVPAQGHAHGQGQIPGPSAGVGAGAQNPALNNNQMAALAKFAALAQAGPRQPHQNQPPFPPQAQAHQAYSGGVQPPPPTSPSRSALPRFSPPKSNVILPPEITAEPMRGGGHGRRISREFGGRDGGGPPLPSRFGGPGPIAGSGSNGDNGYGPRGGGEFGNGNGHGQIPDRGYGPPRGGAGRRGDHDQRGGYGGPAPPRGDRDRSRSPRRGGSDSFDVGGRGRGWGGHRGGGGGGGGGRSQDGGWSSRNGPGQGWEGNYNSVPPSLPQFNSQGGQPPAPAPAPPVPASIQEGRAPPPSWMMESGPKDEKGGEDDGEADMTLDNSDEDDEPTSKNKIPQYQNQNQNQNQSHTPNPVAASGNDHGNGGNVPMSTSTSTSTSTLASFDIASFDPTSPQSWQTLGEAWRNTTGKEPDQVALMHFLATGMVMDPSAQGGGGGGMSMGGF